MTESEFHELFLKALEASAENAESQLGRPISRNFVIRLIGTESNGQELSTEQASKVLYLGPDTFYRVIDLSVIRVAAESTVVFTRVSGHSPSTIDMTANYHAGLGPFNQLIAEKIEVGE